MLPVTGLLVVAAMPIGDPRDASPRLHDMLSTADVIAAEDTRRLRRFARAAAIALPQRVVSYFEGSETTRSDELVAELRAGHTVVLVSDAGTPTLSDPGYRIVSAAIAAGVTVTAVPGPSAVTAALAISGLPTDR